MQQLLVFALLLFSWPHFASSALSEVQVHAQKKQLPLKHWIDVDTQTQELRLYYKEKLLASYPISSAKAGLGEQANSFKTPRGLHIVDRKIGENAPTWAIFKARMNTGKVWDGRAVSDDLVLSRILTLKGLEPGINLGKSERGELVDSKSRYIYIHGTAEEKLIGKPASHGCIRMKNEDIIELFQKVPENCLVWIH